MQLRGGWSLAFIIACALPAFADETSAAGPENEPSIEVEAVTPAEPDAEPIVDGPILELATEPPPKGAPWSIQTDVDSFALIADARGLSLHKPMILLPATWAGRYEGSSTETVFSLSLKFRAHRKVPLYFAYSQKSFLQALNTDQSKPFRDNNFNPELFFRLKPKKPEKWAYFAADLGAEHESNGQTLPDSRSWDRLYVAPYWQKDKTLVYWKWWWRIPERSNREPTDPKRDDNPDIQDYLGWSELRVQQQLFADKHQLSTLLRMNPSTGRGAFGLHYTIPGPGEGFFWTFYAFNGYGESLLDYDRSVTRIGFGISVAR